MATKLLERFEIKGLHGGKHVVLNIEDNTLVLVGENGSGKTTILRIIFNFLSGHWPRLIKYRFDSLTATIAGEEYSVTHEDLTKSVRVVHPSILRELPPPLRRKIMDLIERGESGQIMAELGSMTSRYGISSTAILRQLEFFDDVNVTPKKKFTELIHKVQTSIGAQILYLPTYRRIERELESIFEGIDQDNFRRQKERSRGLETDESYIELVEFGMKDVQKAIDGVLENLRGFAREQLNSLTLRYLGDVVNQEYQNVNTAEIASASDETVSAVLNRIDETILTSRHKDRLISVINSAKSATTFSEHDKIIYHYFLKLLRFQEALHTEERHISAFCKLCSDYIVDKRFVYNSANFSFEILANDSRDVDTKIDVGDLSSGEKQIVSLFSHLYLSGRGKYFVMIDEPELSLSVPWQRRFLTDIRSGGFCSGLIAVTHSPFIYENDLRKYTHALGEFVSM